MSKNDSDKQRRFIEEYCVDFCAKDAALRAGYKDGKGIRSQASDLLARPNIQEAIQKRMSELAERCAVTTDSITQQLYDTYELAMCGTVDRGKNKPVAMATPSAAAAVSALMAIAKLHGLITDKQELTGKNGAPLVPGKMLVELVDPADIQSPDPA